MLQHILSSTPAWVFVLFGVLLALGLVQMRSYRASLLRVAVLPVTMKTLAVWGVISAFGTASPAVFSWVASALVAAVIVLRLPLPATTRYDASTRTFAVTGSIVPLALMMGIFFTKYVVAVQLAMHPALAHQTDFTLAVGTIYGAFSGIFAGRGIRLGLLAIRAGSRGNVRVAGSAVAA